MKLNAFDTGGEVISSNAGQAGTFGITATGLKIISHILRDKLYHDKVMAPIREYTSNAYDAQVMAGKKNTPLRINLPTVTASTFSIRDYGVGLTEEEVAELYTKYGESTKRNSNKTIGSFGIGCKSAFCISNNFLVTTFKDGKKMIYNCYLDTDGDGKYSKMHEEETVEENGVEISIPVDANKISEWNQKFLKFSHFIEPKPIINIDYSKLIERYGSPFSSSNVLLKGDKWEINGTNQVVMGIVPYVFNYEHLKINDRVILNILSKGITLFAPIGAVDPTANREGLEYTDKTIKYISNRLKEIEKSLKDVYQKEIDALQTEFEVKCYLCKKNNSDSLFTSLFPNKTCTWQGKTVDSRIKIKSATNPNLQKNIEFNVIEFSSYNNRIKKERASYYYYDYYHLDPDPNDLYIINDLALQGRLLNNRVGRICYDRYKENKKGHVYLIELKGGISVEEALSTDIGITPFKKISEIAEDEHWRPKDNSAVNQVNRVVTPASKTLILKKDGIGHYAESKYWKTQKITENDVGFYVELDRFESVIDEHNSIKGTKLLEINEFLKLHFGIDKPIYGFKIGYLTEEKKKEFKNLSPLFETLYKLIDDHLIQNKISESIKLDKCINDYYFSGLYRILSNFLKKLPYDHILKKYIIDADNLIALSKVEIKKHEAFVSSLQRLKISNKNYFADSSTVDPKTGIESLKIIFDYIETNYPMFHKIINNLNGSYISLEKFMTSDEINYILIMDQHNIDKNKQKV